MVGRLQSSTRDLGRLARWLAIGFLVADAALNAVLAFQPYNTSVPSDQHYFDSVASMPDLVNFFVGALLCAALLVGPKTRNFAVGFGLGFCALWLADVVFTLRWPKSGPGTAATVAWCETGCRVLAGPAAVCVLLVGLLVNGGRPPTLFEQRPKPRLIVLILGLAAFGCLLLSDFIAKISVTVPGPNGSHQTADCCSFGSLTIDDKLDLAAMLVVGIALTLLAARVRAAAVASGIFAGMFTTMVAVVAVPVAAIYFPIEFHIGMQNRAIPAGTVLHASAYPAYSPRAGFWLAAAFVALLGLLAILSGLMYRSARDIFSAQAYHVPHTGLPSME